jgi:ABC-type phosphate transport system substrate-binding protein
VSVGNATEIVVNQSVPVGEYSLNKTRAIFTMRQRFWPNGKNIKVFVLADNNPLHKNFTKNNLNMFPHQLRRVWDRMVFSGTGRAPMILNTEEEMLDKISNTPNAIGYLNSSTENEKIRLFEFQ